jgi:hypothetical protein
VQFISKLLAPAIQGKVNWAHLAKRMAAAGLSLALEPTLTISAAAANAGQGYSPSGPASIDDYMKTSPDFPDAYDFRWLGK